MNKRWLTIVTSAYALLILYGSVMPWDFSAGAEELAGHWQRLWSTWPLGHGAFNSRSDELANFVFYVPLGLLVACRCAVGGASRGAACLLGFAAGAVLSVTVEGLQLFSIVRVSSMSDVITNGAGAAVGGVVGGCWGAAAWMGLSRRAGKRVGQPWALAALVLMFALAVDAFCPWVPTFSLSDIWHNVKGACVSLPQGMGMHTWDYWLVNRVGVYCVLAMLLAAWRREGRKPAWLTGALAATAFAGFEEAGKLLIAGRFNIANVAMSAAGAALGALLGWAVVGRMNTKHKLGLAWLAIFGYAAYMEWGFFDFEWSPDAMAGKMPCGVTWFPLYQDVMSGRPEDLLNFLGLLFVPAALAFVGRVYADRVGYRGLWSSPARAAFWGGMLGLALELGQFLVPGRYPATGDVLCFALGGAIGSHVAGVWQTRRRGGTMKTP
jgi:VanZ family protein